MQTLYIGIRSERGLIAYQRIGEAILEQDIDASLTKLALRRKCDPLVNFTAYSPRQAAEAMQLLEELGDVPVHARDFEAQWFDPREGIATIESLLESRARPLTTRVRTELALLQRLLLEAARNRGRFHLAKVDSEKGLAGEGLFSRE